MATEAIPPPLAKRFGHAVKRAQHALRIAMDESLRPLALTTPQYSVMSAIEAEPGISNARLARAEFVTPPTMHGLLTNLERSALIARHSDSGDGRKLRTHLTDRGWQMLTEAHERVAEIEASMMASIGEANLAGMTTALSRFAEILQTVKTPAVMKATE